jgi:uncharacterized protein (TIGR03086 family)
MSHPDLAPAAKELARLVAGVRDDQLSASTPCADYPLAALIDHVDGLSEGFVLAARKQVPPAGVDPTPSGDASRLRPDWRTAIPVRLDAMAAAWRDPAAWEGMTSAGGIDLPGEVCGTVAMDELVVHGWDVARATGQEFSVDDASVAAARAFVDQFSGPGTEGSRGGLFGPEVAVPADASPLEALICLSGRDPRAD